MLERRGVHRLEEIGDTGRRIAIDPFLVLEEQGDPTARLRAGQLGHPIDDRFAMRSRIVAGWDVEAEDANPGGLVEIREFHRPLEALEVLVERLGDPDLADRRADRAEAEPAREEPFAKFGVLGVGQVEDVRAMDGAELDELDAMSGQDIELLVGILRDLVGEGTDADHRSLPGSWIARQG